MSERLSLNPIQLCFLNAPRLYERFVARLAAMDPLYHEARLAHLHFAVPPNPVAKPTRLQRRNHFWDIFCKPNPDNDRCAFVSDLHDKVKRQQEAIRNTGLAMDNATAYLFIIGRLDDLDTLSVAHLLPKYISDNRWNIWGNAQIEYASIGLFYLPNSASLTNEQRAAMFAFWEETQALHEKNDLGLGFRKMMLLSDSNTSRHHRLSYAELGASDLEDLVIETLLGLTSAPEVLRAVIAKPEEQAGLDDETMSLGTCALATESRFKEETLYAEFARAMLNAYADPSDKLLDDDDAKVKAKELATALPIEPEELVLKLLSSGKGEANILQRLKLNWENLRPPNLSPFNLFTEEWLTAYIPALQKLPARLKLAAENLLSLGLMNFRYALGEREKKLEAELDAELSRITDDLMRNPNANHLSPTQTLRALTYLLEEIQSRFNGFREKVANMQAFQTLSFLSTKDENELYASSEWAEEGENDATKEKMDECFGRLRAAIERFPVPLAFWSRYFSLALVGGYLGEYILSAIPTVALNIGIQTVTGLPFVVVFVVILLFGLLRYYRARMNVFHHRNLYVALVEKAARREAKQYLLKAVERCYQAAIKKTKAEIEAVNQLLEHLKLVASQEFRPTVKEETLFHRSIWSKIPTAQDTLNLSLNGLPELEQPIMDSPPKFTIAKTDRTLEEILNDERQDALKSLLNQFAKLSFQDDDLRQAFDPRSKKPFDNWRRLLEPPPSDLLQVAIPLEREPESEWHRLIYLCKRFARGAYQHVFKADLAEVMQKHISEARRKEIADYFEKMSRPPVPRTDSDDKRNETFLIAQPASIKEPLLLTEELKSQNVQPKAMVIGRAMQWFYWAHFPLESILWHKAARSVFERLSETERRAMHLSDDILGVPLKTPSPEAQPLSDDSETESVAG